MLTPQRNISGTFLPETYPLFKYSRLKFWTIEIDEAFVKLSPLPMSFFNSKNRNFYDIIEGRRFAMKSRHLAIVTIVAAFSLLAFVFSSWVKPFQSQSNQQINHTEQLFCSVPTSSSIYLAEVKPKLAGFGVATQSNFVIPEMLLQRTSFHSLEQKTIAVESAPRALWLLHRSLLI
jgi:hypothetical protein